ncbi:3-oxo-5-alpha-steroid 4-dehydrogenase 2 [Dioscorea cayenensis subsp. rotundata]|uniref:3-oxo-5-alpha-steroid 4-dehydrogenase 2 n=1 Tax=Dioscorea cayennensis subsp. rotundata TaxID=55577 RepID=A0AB40BW68_DIOCR|nr:3-oxo-5-alpha-steroid 4-dehydrogenase 2 [Dioscorea cayenensis subsp. rotundata]
MSPITDLLLFPPPPSPFITAMSVISLTSLAYTGVSEVYGKHLHYSKFWNANPNGRHKGIELSSRAGMLLIYSPALAAALASFSIPGCALSSTRSLLLSAALSIHYFKRVFEVLFIHQYSGRTMLDSVLLISLSYFMSAVSTIYSQYLTENTAEPAFDLKYAGVLLFVIGIIGNFYHHYILSQLRGKDDKSYKIPKGGLFSLVICPHYLFEILGFIGVSLISQTVYAVSFTLGSMFYLLGRSYATRKWYLSKFDNFPKNVKALIPFVF